MEWPVWLAVDMDLGGCASGQTWTAAKADVHGRCSRIFIPRPAHVQYPSHASRGKFCPSPAPLPLGWLPERHPCAGTLGVLWWGVHEDWGLPDSLQTRVGQGPLVPLQWDLSYPRTPCGPPRTPETPNRADLGPSQESGPSTPGRMQAGPSCLCCPAPASPLVPASPSGPRLFTPLTSQATWCSTTAWSAFLEISMLPPSGLGSHLGREHPSRCWEEHRCRGRRGRAANGLC